MEDKKKNKKTEINPSRYNEIITPVKMTQNKKKNMAVSILSINMMYGQHYPKCTN